MFASYYSMTRDKQIDREIGKQCMFLIHYFKWAAQTHNRYLLRHVGKQNSFFANQAYTDFATKFHCPCQVSPGQRGGTGGAIFAVPVVGFVYVIVLVVQVE